MNMVCPDEGKELFLAILFSIGGETAGALTLHGFQNNYTPDDDTTVSSFVESTFTGYGSIAVVPGDWSAPAIVSHVAETERSPVPTWSCVGGSAQDLWGWYLTDDSAGVVVLAQRFDSVRSMVPGAVESLNPFKVKLKSFA